MLLPPGVLNNWNALVRLMIRSPHCHRLLLEFSLPLNKRPRGLFISSEHQLTLHLCLHLRWLITLYCYSLQVHLGYGLSRRHSGNSNNNLHITELRI